MKIKMLSSFAGVDFSVAAGEETERFSDDEAGRMIVAGFAVAVAPAAPEMAVKKAPAKTAAKKSAPETRG